MPAASRRARTGTRTRTGRRITQWATPSQRETLRRRLVAVGTALLLANLDDLLHAHPVPQEGEATYAAKLTVEEFRLDWSRPAEVFAGVIAEHEAHAPAHVGLAACLAQAGDRAGAERHLLRALELEPGMPEARHNLDLLRAGR